MDKLAQKRSLRSKVWENVNLTGKALEGMHAELAAVMDKMRTIDEEIRSIAEDVRPLIRQAKANLRQRDYLNAAHQITGFHARVRTVSHILDTFQKNVEIGNYEYFLKDFEGPEQEELFKYNPNADIKEACEDFDSLLKEAGLYDWTKEKILSGKDVATGVASNVITDKGRARRLLEKRFNTDFVKKIKVLTTTLVSRSEKMLRDLLNIFNDLETGVSRRNPKLYIAKAKEFVAKFKSYHDVYVNYHAEIIAPLKAHQESMKGANKEQAVKNEALKQEQEKVRKQKEYEDYNTKIEEAGNQYEKQVQEQSRYQPPQPARYTEPSFNEWKQRNTPKPAPQANLPEDEEYEAWEKKYNPSSLPKENVSDSEKAKKLREDEEFEKMKNRIMPKAHSNFFDKITIYATNNETSSFVNELLEYSHQLEETDPEASANLLTVAHNVINDHKTAGIFDFLKGKPGVTAPATEKVQPAVEEKPLRSGLQYLKQKPQELVEERQQLMRPKKLDLPEGRIDRAYTDLGILRTITPDKIRITPAASKFIINMFVKRLGAAQNIDNLEQYAPDIETKLILTLKQAIYNGWVVQADNVMDEFNPNDKYIEVYTRLNLSDITPSLSGVAKLYVSCRLSANNNTLTVKNLTKHFKIENVKSLVTPAETNNSEELGEAEDFSEYDDPNEQYDTE